MTIEFSAKTIRRLTAAEGYLELNMPARALEELDAIDDAGPLEGAVCWLKGEALKAQERYDEAIEPLQRAARMMPAPHSNRAWMSLSECFRQRGQSELADLAESFANSPQAVIHRIMPTLNIGLTFRCEPDDPSDTDLPADSDFPAQ